MADTIDHRAAALELLDQAAQAASAADSGFAIAIATMAQAHALLELADATRAAGRDPIQAVGGKR